VRVARVGKDGATTEKKVDLPALVKNENLYYALGIAPGFLLSRGKNDQGEVRLFAQPLLASGPELVGPAVEIGAVDPWSTYGENDAFASCTSDDAVSVVVRDEYGYRVATEKAGKWTATASPGAYNGFTCKGAEIGFTHSSDRAVITTRCAAGVCQSESAVLPPGQRRSSAYLDGVVATVSRAADRGGVRLRVAPARELATTSSQTLFDDLVETDAVQTTRWVSDFELLPIGATAVLVVVTPKGDWLARVDRAGNVKPIDVVVK
jgi:hypothetical protein